MRRLALIPVVVASLGLLTVGCGDTGGSLPPGNLNVSWLVGSSGCDRAGVETVAVFLTGQRAQGTDLRTFDCRDGGAVLSGLSPGVYDLSLRGRDSDGVDRFGGELAGVEVRSNGTTNVQTVHLSALPAELFVSWYFENGRMCSYNRVTSVDIVLFENEYEISSVTADCTMGEVDLTDIQANTYMVDVIGLDDGGRAVFTGQEEVTVDRGDQMDVEVRLQAVDTTSTRPSVNGQSQ